MLSNSSCLVCIRILPSSCPSTSCKRASSPCTLVSMLLPCVVSSSLLYYERHSHQAPGPDLDGAAPERANSFTVELLPNAELNIFMSDERICARWIICVKLTRGLALFRIPFLPFSFASGKWNFIEHFFVYNNLGFYMCVWISEQPLTG